MNTIEGMRGGGRILCFGDFQLDRIEGRLRRGDDEIVLRAKSFDLLRYLVENRGRVITRDELLNAVWRGAAVSASVVRTTILEVRKALGDEGASLVETIGRRGYRLAGEHARVVGEQTFVGRTVELAQLHDLLERCRPLRRQMIFIAGEPGIGKTTLVQRFVHEVRATGLARVAQGQCIDLHGSTEPYMPVLQMLNGLCQDDPDRKTLNILERWAPSWLLQMPGVVDDRVVESLRQRVPTPTRERMLRELADAFDVLAKTASFVLVFEDLHWSDASTIDLLKYLAEHTTPARLLIIGTYRPVDAVVSGHAIRGTVRDLLARGRAVERALDALTPQDVEAYVTDFLAGAPIDAQLVEMMHRRTDGNPLFLRAIIEYLLDQEALAITDGRWQLTAGENSVPPSLRELVVRELEVLTDEEQRMLAAASVVGVEFDAISVAAASNQLQDAVEQRCARLATRGQLVQTSGTTRWPDKTMGGTFKFLHALHRDIVYNHLAPAERARLHGAVAERLERGWSWERTSVAAVLAGHFECATDWLKAAQYHLTAVDASKARLANHEVVVHCRAALSLLPQLPPSSERDRIEMASSLELATGIALTRGYGAAEVRPLVHRARNLARVLELPQVEVIALGGLYMFEAMGGEQKRVLELAGELMDMAEQFKLPLFVLMAHGAIGSAHYNLGNLAAARSHLEQARATWGPSFPNLRIDPRLMFLGAGALVLQQLGDAAEADAWIGALIACLPEFTDPMNAIGAYRAVATYRHWEGDREGALAWAERAIALADEHGLAEYEAMAMIEKGYAIGDLSMQRQGFAVLHAAGYRAETPTHRLGMAETLIDQGRWDEAREEIALALAASEATGEVRHLSEIHRVGAQCLRAAGQLDAAAAALHAAIDVARRQQSRPLEQRALADLDALSSHISLAETRRTRSGT